MNLKMALCIKSLEEFIVSRLKAMILIFFSNMGEHFLTVHVWIGYEYNLNRWTVEIFACVGYFCVKKQLKSVPPHQERSHQQ